MGGRFSRWNTGLRAQPRARLVAASAALCILALAASLLVLMAQQPHLPAQLAEQTAPIPSPTASPTATPTHTPTAAPTPTATLQPAPPPVTKKVSGIPLRVPAPPPSLPPRPVAPPTATPCPTATPAPTGTATPTATPTVTPTATSTATPSPTATTLALAVPRSACTPCGVYAGTNPSQSAIRAALDAAAARYGLPTNLLYGVAWQESQWHEDVESCDGGIGLMQVQYYTYPWLNSLSQPECGLTATQYNDPRNSVQDNAYLGAKFLKWLQCLYAYNSPNGGTASAPVNGGSAYNYQQAGLAYPDTQKLGGAPITAVCAQGSGGTPAPTAAPSSCGLCLTLYQRNGNGPTDTLYQDLPASAVTPWACPFDPQKGVGDYELLDLVLSAYNAGPGSISNCSCVPNLGYVGAVEYWITEFRNGLLPKSS